MVLGDDIPELVHFYRQVRDRPGAVAFALSGLCVNGIGEDNYYRVRAMDPWCAHNPVALAPDVAAARTAFLNKLGYNGVYRVNAKGGFNVPAGDKSKGWRESVVERKGRDAIGSIFPNKEKWHDVSEALKGSTIYCGDFEAVVNLSGDGDVIYADPPYDGTYNSYTTQGFSADDQARLASALVRAWRRGAAVFASNADTELVRDLYGWAEILDSTEQRTINADTGGRVPAKCVFIGSPGALLWK
jgi:DNA adenine methylase